MLSSTWVLCALTLAPVVFLIRHLRQHLKHNRNFANIPGPKGINWGGAFAWLNDPERGWDFFHHVNKNYGGMVKLSTPLGCNDMLYISDPLATMHVVRKDEDSFDEPLEIHLMLQLVLGVRGLGSTHGHEHARQRRYLNPLFHASRLRQLPPTFYGVSQRLLSSLEQLTADGPTTIDMSHWGNRASFELVGQGAVGHSFDTLKVGDEPNLYGEDMKMGFVALSTAAARLALKYALPNIASLSTPNFNRWMLTLVPDETVGLVNKFIRDLDSTSKHLYEERKSAMMKGETEDGKDIMSGMIRDLVLDPKRDHISDEEGTSHLRTLLFAATDTTSSAILRTLLVLAHHPKVQFRLREEIKNARDSTGGDLDYDTLMSLPLLNAVFLETMRLYPPACYVDRLALKDTILPLAYPIQGLDGSPITQVLVPKGTTVTLSLVGVNRHEGVWGPDADVWNPDRWLDVDEQGKGAVKDDRMPGISSHIMTFMDGKRHCLGWRYVQLELKVVISELVRSFAFSPAKGLDDKIHWPMGLSLSPFVGDKMSMPLDVSPL